jgi:hypothetical protein
VRGGEGRGEEGDTVRGRESTAEGDGKKKSLDRR